MDGVGEEVYLFAAFSVLACVALYKSVVYVMDTFSSGPSHPSSTSDMASRGRTRSSQYDCAICLGQAEFSVETNCGHVYCGDCLLEVWRRSSQLSATACPYCRQRITLILPYFSVEERDSADPEDAEKREKILSELSTYNRRYSGEPRSVMEHLRDLPMLLRHLLIRFYSGEGLHLAFQLRIVVLASLWLLYLLSPLDLIPEAVFGFFGLLDDLVIFLLISAHLTFIFRTLMANMGGNGGEPVVEGVF